MDDFNGALAGALQEAVTRVGAYVEVAKLTVGWFTETGPEHVTISGSSNPFIQLLQHEEGVNAARETFKTEGCPSSTKPYLYRHNAQRWETFGREMWQALTGDPVGAFLGSYDVEIWNGRGSGEVIFHVHNPTNRESFLRFPGIGPLLQRKTREQTQGLDNWGGDMYEDFWWDEPNPCDE